MKWVHEYNSRFSALQKRSLVYMQVGTDIVVNEYK